MTDWLKEHLDGIVDKIDSSKEEVLRALDKHEQVEMAHIKRMEKRLKDLEAWKGRATLALGVLLVVVLASSPFVGAVLTVLV